MQATCRAKIGLSCPWTRSSRHKPLAILHLPKLTLWRPYMVKLETIYKCWLVSCTPSKLSLICPDKLQCSIVVVGINKLWKRSCYQITTSELNFVLLFHALTCLLRLLCKFYESHSNIAIKHATRKKDTF